MVYNGQNYEKNVKLGEYNKQEEKLENELDQIYDDEKWFVKKKYYNKINMILSSMVLGIIIILVYFVYGEYFIYGVNKVASYSLRGGSLLYFINSLYYTIADMDNAVARVVAGFRKYESIPLKREKYKIRLDEIEKKLIQLRKLKTELEKEIQDEVRKPKVVFVDDYNNSISQIAEALANHFFSEVFDCCSAGIYVSTGLNIDNKIDENLINLMKELYRIDMGDKYTKSMEAVLPVDIAIILTNGKYTYNDIQCSEIIEWNLNSMWGVSNENNMKIIRDIQIKIFGFKNSIFSK